MTPAAEPSESIFQPYVSVVIPIYNGEADLPALLECLRSQTYPAHLAEYLLVDNGSRDRTLAILQATPQVCALSETQIQSSYAARNTGIRAAKGSIIAFTDADCRPHPEWLAQLVQPFVNPAIAIVAGEILALPSHTLLERYADRHETLSQKHTLAHSFRPYGQTANLAVRRQVFEQVGLFRPHLTTGGDADICWRILQQNSRWQLLFSAGAIVRHRHRSTVAELCSQWQRYGRSNQYLHELHGISLTKDMSQKDYLYRWSRWLLKEVPIAAMNKLMQSNTLSFTDVLLDTPISLICGRARAQGQQQARLKDAARAIAEMEND